MIVQPISIRQPEIGALVDGTMRALIRPLGRLAILNPGDLLWVREPFHLPKAFAIDKPTRAAKRGATPVFITDHSQNWFAHHMQRLLGNRRHAREMPRIWHRQHLKVTAVARLQLHDVEDADLKAAGWRDRDAFRARWDDSSNFYNGAGDPGALWAANPQVLRIAFDRIEGPIPDGTAPQRQSRGGRATAPLLESSEV